MVLILDLEDSTSFSQPWPALAQKIQDYLWVDRKATSLSAVSRIIFRKILAAFFCNTLSDIRKIDILFNIGKTVRQGEHTLFQTKTKRNFDMTETKFWHDRNKTVGADIIRNYWCQYSDRNKIWVNFVGNENYDTWPKFLGPLYPKTFSPWLTRQCCFLCCLYTNRQWEIENHRKLQKRIFFKKLNYWWVKNS